MTSKLKKIITGGLEVIKDSAKQIAGTVSPGVLLEQALGSKSQRNDEFAQYLKGLGPNLTKEELEQKKKEFEQGDKNKLDATRKFLQAAIPPHMRLSPKPSELRPYEAMIRDEERKKAMSVEAQKKQPQPLSTPTGKQPRGMLFGRKKQQAKGFEGLVKDARVG